MIKDNVIARQNIPEQVLRACATQLSCVLMDTVSVNQSLCGRGVMV